MVPNWIERKRKREQRKEVKWGSPFKLVFTVAANGNGILLKMDYLLVS